MTNALVIVGVLLVLFIIISKSAGGGRISGADARAKVAAGALLLDVRTPDEFRSGHIKGAVNIPVQDLARRMKEVGAKEKAVVVYCRSGMRSGKALAMLKSAGFVDVHNLGPQTAW